MMDALLLVPMAKRLCTSVRLCWWFTMMRRLASAWARRSRLRMATGKNAGLWHCRSASRTPHRFPFNE